MKTQNTDKCANAENCGFVDEIGSRQADGKNPVWKCDWRGHIIGTGKKCPACQEID
jgi:hypothetical protein